jgi:hypothetical protein
MRGSYWFRWAINAQQHNSRHNSRVNPVRLWELVGECGEGYTGNKGKEKGKGIG